MGNYLPPMGHAGWLPDPHITKYVDVCERSAEICQNAAQYVETTITGTTNAVTKLEERVDEATATIDTAVAEARALVPQIEEGIETVQGYVTEAESIKEDIDATHDEIDIAAGVIAESVTNAQGYATAASTSASASAQSATSASDSADDAEDSATTATSAATSASTSATNAASSAATAQSLVDSIPSNVADAIVQEDIPGKVHNYLEDEHISADFEFDTFADYEDAWAAGIVKAGDNIYIKSDERFLYASVDDIVRCTVGDVNDYDNTVLYTVGDYCLYKHRLWMCKIESRAVTPVEGAVWSLISLSELKQSLSDIKDTSTLAYYTIINGGSVGTSDTTVGTYSERKLSDYENSLLSFYFLPSGSGWYRFLGSVPTSWLRSHNKQSYGFHANGVIQDVDITLVSDTSFTMKSTYSGQIFCLATGIPNKLV